MIRRLHAKNYGCLKDVITPELTPLHAFIGPNDSGKSTLLKAVRIGVSYASTADTIDLEAAPQAGDRNPVGTDRTELQGSGEIRLDTDASLYYGLQWHGLWRTEEYGRAVGQEPQRPIRRVRRFPPKMIGDDRDLGPLGEGTPEWRSVVASLRGARMIRLDPDALRQPSDLIVGPVDFSGDRGQGLAGVLDVLVNRGDETWQSIRGEVFRLFPTIRRLGLRNVPDGQNLGGDVGERHIKKIVEIELSDKTVVGANDMSEGLLYYLGFLATQNLDPTALLLVEEPENGLHPSRIADVVRVLRAMTQGGTQVLMATHSPLVINELQPEEVTFVTRHPELGTQLTPLSKTKNFEDRSKIYALGELWLSYADGDTEAELVGPPA